MNEIVRERLHTQKLAARNLLADPAEVVSWLGAVQAQDYPGARWSLGLRARGATDARVREAFDAGLVLRTHVLRPTWHFVAPADIRWMLALTAPRVNMMSVYQYRQHELDGRLFVRTQSTLEKALRNGNHLTRPELSSVLQRAGIVATGQRLAQIVMRAELDGVICSGPARNTQPTYALIAERAPRATILTREEALAELTRRYFTSRGPATLRDFMWWSSLTMRDARDGLAMNRHALVERAIDGRTYWSGGSPPRARNTQPFVHLLPTYDEYVIGYKDRDSIMDRSRAARIAVREEFGQHLMIDGRLKGSWKRSLTAAGALVEFRSRERLTAAESDAVSAAAARYGRFLEREIAVVLRR
jgi:hypothetical protein